jgi:tRNA pseudouridine38-40 synthase
MGTTRLDIEYDGTRFSGWAAQPGLRTVQGELEAALATVLRRKVSLTVAGRTDAGVHAWGQVASFEAREGAAADELGRALNALTGDDLSVLAVSEADGFDARRDARSRTYCYRVLAERVPNPFERGLSLHWPHSLEEEALERCAAAVAGTHDFTAFTPTQTDHVRFEREVLSCGWRRGRPIVGDGSVLELWIEADAFMRSMVRILVGTLLEVAGGRRSADDFAALLKGAPRERAGATAPAHGLYLASVRYGQA